MDAQTMSTTADALDERALRFVRSSQEIKAEIARLKTELAEFHRHETMWAQHAVASSVPVIGATELAHTLWESHRLKRLIRGLERDLQNIEANLRKA